MSEIYVGKALKKFAQAGEVTVCSKSGSYHPPILRADMEVSRFCLQRDQIDVYYVHVPAPSLDQLRRVLDVYEQFKKEGKIRFIGVSNRGLMTPQELDEAYELQQDPRIEVMQFPYSFGRPEVGPVIAAARKRGIGIVVRQALEGGMFTDKFRPGHNFTDRANDWRAGIDPECMEEALQRLEAIRREFVKPPYKSLAQLALAYVLSNPDVSATIPGAGSPEEMRDNLTVNELPLLPAQTLKAITEAARGLISLMRNKN